MLTVIVYCLFKRLAGTLKLTIKPPSSLAFIVLILAPWLPLSIVNSDIWMLPNTIFKLSAFLGNPTPVKVIKVVSSVEVKVISLVCLTCKL